MTNEQIDEAIDWMKEWAQELVLMTAHNGKEDALKTILTALEQSKENDNDEWFFRWIARGKSGQTTMENAIEMIWNRPDNPYFDNPSRDNQPKKESN